MCRRQRGAAARPVPANSSTPAVYKIKPLFRARAKGLTIRRTALARIKVSGRLRRGVAQRIIYAAGAAGPAPTARSKAPEIKGTAARSASVIIIMQALRGARDSGEMATRAARAPRWLPPLPAVPVPPFTCQQLNKTNAFRPCNRTSHTSSRRVAHPPSIINCKRTSLFQRFFCTLF